MRDAWILSILLMSLCVASAVDSSSVVGEVSSSRVPAGSGFRLRCSAVGPRGMRLRLACPLTAPVCFENCLRPLCRDASEHCQRDAPELMAAECSISRGSEPVPTGGGGWPMTAEFWFPMVGARHSGNYTCQFMRLSHVSSVEVFEAPTTSTAAKAAAVGTSGVPTVATVSAGRTSAADSGATRRPARPLKPPAVGGSDAGAMPGDLNMATQAIAMVTTGPVTVAKETPKPSFGDWFKIELLGPITTGHVIAAGLSLIVLLICGCLTAWLLCCYCRRRRRKLRIAKLTSASEGWPPMSQPPKPLNAAASLNGGGSGGARSTATAAAETSWTSSPIYAEVDSSPLISGGGAHRKPTAPAGFGSHGNGLDTRGTVGGGGGGGGGGGAAGSSGDVSGSFLSRDQAGRHSFHSVRHQQLQRSQEHQSASLLLLVASQQADILRLSRQLRDSQRQMDRLAASQTDLHRCLSAAGLRTPQQQHQPISPSTLPDLDATSPDVDDFDFAGSFGDVVGSTDALTVETIDEEFEADGTLRVPKRRGLSAPLS